MAQAANERESTGPGLNEVQLIGRISASAERRVMPSDDELVSFRLVVDREPVRRSSSDRKRPTVDVIDVACWTSKTRKAALGLQAGDVVRVQGALRRRFWKAGGGAVSRHEVEASTVGKVRGAPGRR